MQHGSRTTQVARGTIAATTATYTALFAHIVGGGAVPSAIGVLVPLVLSVFVSVLLSGRRLSFVRLAVSVTISTALFHALFVLGTPQPSDPSAPPLSPHAGHIMPGQVLTLTGNLDAAAFVGDSAMWGAHLVGALITTLLLYRGERELQWLREVGERLAQWLGLRALVRPVLLHRTASAALTRACAFTVPRLLDRVVGTTRTLRGPPERDTAVALA